MRITRNLLLFVTLNLSVMISVSCVQPISPTLPTTPTAGEVEENLKNLQFQEFGDALGTGSIPPEMASYRNNPASALGAIFAKVAKTDQSCSSSEATDFVLLRIVGPTDSGPQSTCTAETSGPTEFEERIVKGGLETGITYVVGEAGINADFAFEFHITNPLVALYPASQECVNTSRIAAIPPPQRTCDILFVTGATLTQATYRQYVEVKGNAEYNAVVKVGGKAYGSSSSLQSRQLLTVDFISLGNWFAPDENGFLQARASVTEEMQELTPDEFEKEVALTSEEKKLIQGISMQDLSNR